MHIYLHHITHGTKVAISELEAAMDEAKGWVRYFPGECVAVIDEIESLEIVQSENTLANAPVVRNRRKVSNTGG